MASEISDIGSPISDEDSADGQDDRDIGGYRGGRITQEEFRKGRPLYKDSGFESIEEYLDHVENEWRAANGLEPLPREAFKRHPTLDEEGGRQVGLRLPASDYERLVELGDRNGVAPATMARILVVRAVRTAQDLAEVDD